MTTSIDYSSVIVPLKLPIWMSINMRIHYRQCSRPRCFTYKSGFLIWRVTSGASFTACLTSWVTWGEFSHLWLSWATSLISLSLDWRSNSRWIVTTLRHLLTAQTQNACLMKNRSLSRVTRRISASRWLQTRSCIAFCAKIFFMDDVGKLSNSTSRHSRT